MQTSETIHPEQLKHAANTEYKGLGPVIQVEPKEDAVLIRGVHGNMTIRRTGHGMLRLTCALQEDSSLLAPTPAVLPAADRTGWRMLEEEGNLKLQIEDQVILVDKGTMTVSCASGPLKESNSLSFYYSGSSIRCLSGLGADASIYGLGETTGFLDKRGEKYTMWNSDIFDPHVPDMESLYQSIPVLIHHSDSGTYGLFIDEPGRLTIDMRENRDQLLLETCHGHIDLYLIAGSGIKDVVASYGLLTGRMELPPIWALGYQQSRFSYMNQDEVLQLAATFREKQIPCDVIYLDIHYMDEYKVFSFDPDRFPDPKEMISRLKDMGFRIVPVVDPGVKMEDGFEVFEQGQEGEHFCRKSDGSYFVGDVWPGASVFPDFTEKKTRDWWGSLHRFYVEHGISGIWNDMNEPSVFNSLSKTLDPDVIHGNDGRKRTHEELHNLYGLMMCEATREGLSRELDGQRPFVLTRAGYAGIQRYAAVWTGDNRSYWEHMELFMTMGLNLGMSGIAFCGADVGGFMHHTSGELLVRWTQMGAFTPFFRNHSAIETRTQEPWRFGAEVEAICRKFIELRYRMLPYMYSLFRASARDGLPIMSPLVMHFPQDPQVRNLSDQFMLGSSLLVAPICRPGRTHRMVYLPEGIWYDYWTGERMEGSRHVIAHAPLDVIPLYVKGGGILPTVPAVQHTGKAQWHDLRVDIYAAGAAKAEAGTANEFCLYEDDGTSEAYKQGAYRCTSITFAERDNQASLVCQEDGDLKGTIPAEDRSIRFVIHYNPFIPTKINGIPEYSRLHDLEHQQSGWYYDRQDNHLYIKCLISEAAGAGLLIEP